MILFEVSCERNFKTRATIRRKSAVCRQQKLGSWCGESFCKFEHVAMIWGTELIMYTLATPLTLVGYQSVKDGWYLRAPTKPNSSKAWTKVPVVVGLWVDMCGYWSLKSSVNHESETRPKLCLKQLATIWLVFIANARPHKTLNWWFSSCLLVSFPGVFDGRPADYLFMLIFCWLLHVVSFSCCAIFRPLTLFKIAGTCLSNCALNIARQEKKRKVTAICHTATA